MKKLSKKSVKNVSKKNSKKENKLINIEFEKENEVENSENETLENKVENEEFPTPVLKNKEKEKEENKAPAEALENQEKVEEKGLTLKEKIEEAKKPKIKKTSIIYDLLERPQGSTIEELMEATDWQKHSVRGTLSNMQKEMQFQLIKLETSTPDFDKGGFIKKCTYFIRSVDCLPEINCKVIED